MPAEWEPHAATWLSWPHNRETWPGAFDTIPGVWTELVRTLATSEPVMILAGGAEVLADAQQHVGDVPRVTFFDIRTDDAWTRDHGPTFLVGNAAQQPALVNWEYNAWGGKYPPFDNDNRVGRQLAERLGYQRYSPGIVCEGGAVDVNGRGTVLTTPDCILNPNRNPGLSRSDAEHIFAAHLNAPHVVWLSGGLAGDDTDGHVDEMTRFVGPRSVFTWRADDPRGPNHKPLAENLAHLRTVCDQDGRPLEVIPLQMPPPIYFDDHRLPASYANFYVATQVVVVPTFAAPSDQAAIETIGKLFPDRRTVGLPAVDLVWGLGAFHCVTQQQPAT